MAECNCQVKAILGQTEQVEIIYCPKHAAAPDMYKALREVDNFLVKFSHTHYIIDNDGDFQILKNHIAKALAKAEGK